MCIIFVGKKIRDRDQLDRIESSGINLTIETPAVAGGPVTSAKDEIIGDHIISSRVQNFSNPYLITEENISDNLPL